LLRIDLPPLAERQRESADAANVTTLRLVADDGSASSRWIKRDALERARRDPELYARIATVVADLVNRYDDPSSLPSAFAGLSDY
jgi:hypothetical protein